MIKILQGAGEILPKSNPRPTLVFWRPGTAPENRKRAGLHERLSFAFGIGKVDASDALKNEHTYPPHASTHTHKDR